MSIRRKIMRALYPLLMAAGRSAGRNGVMLANEKRVAPPQSLYDLSIILNNGETLPLSRYKGRKILIANTASDCGYTHQYKALQALYEKNQEKLIVIAFPANDFNDQEKGADAAIAQFCEINYGVTFPLAKKSMVVKGPDQHPVFRWLTHQQYNGWNDKAPSWNFSKFLISETGELTHYFDPGISPLSKTVLGALRS